VPSLPEQLSADPAAPELGFARCVGKINAADFDYAYGFPTYKDQTLLCLPPQVKFTQMPLGRFVWEIKFNFLYQPSGWNKFPAADGNLYAARWFPPGPAPGMGALIYGLADFSSLFYVPVVASYH
jgi:hypothetical protein